MVVGVSEGETVVGERVVGEGVVGESEGDTVVGEELGEVVLTVGLSEGPVGARVHSRQRLGSASPIKLGSNQTICYYSCVSF